MTATELTKSIVIQVVELERLLRVEWELKLLKEYLKGTNFDWEYFNGLLKDFNIVTPDFYINKFKREKEEL